jgi:U4/U6 small nuclear ribonucleoprotein PRP4
LSRVYIETGQLPAFHKQKTHLRDEDNEYFLYEGDENLRQARLQMAEYSLKQAAVRVEKSKIKKETVDPIEEEEIIDNELKEIPRFEISMSQFADPSCVSKGVFSPDGKYFATSGWSGLCKVWKIPSCDLQTTLLGHHNRAIDIQFHPHFGTDANNPISLATSGADNSVRLWPLDETEEFQKSFVLKGHEDRVNKVRFHPMGKHVVSTSHDKTWKFWDCETRKELLTQTGHSKPVFACSIQPDGSLVVSIIFIS